MTTGPVNVNATAQMLKAKRAGLERKPKMRRGGYDPQAVTEILDFAAEALDQFEVKAEELVTRVAELSGESPDEERQRVMRAKLTTQASEAELELAKQRCRVLIQAAETEGIRRLEEAERRAALVPTPDGLPPCPQPSGDMVSDALRHADWLAELGEFIGVSADEWRPRIAEAIEGLQRAAAALDARTIDRVPENVSAAP